jgi:hypothetical protein
MESKKALTWEELMKHERATFITDNKLIILLTIRDGCFTNSN